MQKAVTRGEGERRGEGGCKKFAGVLRVQFGGHAVITAVVSPVPCKLKQMQANMCSLLQSCYIGTSSQQTCTKICCPSLRLTWLFCLIHNVAEFPDELGKELKEGKK